MQAHLVEEKIRKILNEKLGIFIEQYEEYLDKSMLCPPINMQSRDLLRLYIELEDAFGVDMSELVNRNRFDHYYDIVTCITAKV